MTRQDKHDVREACLRLMKTAEAFVRRAPRQKRIEAERSALYKALYEVQLVLSVTRLPLSNKDSSKREGAARVLEKELKQSKANLARSQHALEQMDYLIEPVATKLDDLQVTAKKVQTVLKSALRSPARVLPFRKSR
ncbi:MAG: hypothetical protein A4E19_04525 [Nitrospira sp. SG-bin1]|nr:MAG: hypothetical protein A4E19_04525 [Nitrospira sp. SG-bin1]